MPCFARVTALGGATSNLEDRANQTKKRVLNLKYGASRLFHSTDVMPEI